MSRLFRPHVPLEVRCRVALRQLARDYPIFDHPEHYFTIYDGTSKWRTVPLMGLITDDSGPRLVRMTKGLLLGDLLSLIAKKFGCQVEQLRLDHDPPLAARPRYRRGLGRKTYYQPPANDPDHLNYRPHGPEFAGSHLIKTNVRGDGAQFPDRVLIKRERHRLRKKAGRGARKGGGRKLNPGKAGGRRAGLPKGRKLQSGNRWPPKGSQRLRRAP